MSTASQGAADGSTPAADPTKPASSWVSPKLSAILGIVSVVATGLAAIVPPPWGGLVAILGFCGAALSGASQPTLGFAAGKPIVGPAAVTALGTLGAGAQTVAAALPTDSWQSSTAYVVSAVLAWLAGKSAPQLKH